MLHGDGRRWHLVGLRLLTSFVDGMAQNGHGGLWLVTNGAALRCDWFFDHMLRTGILFKQPGPSAPGTSFGQIAPISSPLTWAPGTRSAWAVGTLIPQHGAGVQGAIFSYRP